VNFARFFVEKCKEAGIATFYWMGLSDRNDRENLKWTMPDLKDAIIKGYYGDAGYTSIENVTVASSAKPRKQIENGKVVIVKGENKYTVAGTRLK
jgi:hypothetical protein